MFIKLNPIGPFPQCAKSTLQIMQEKFINYEDDIGNLNEKILKVKIVTLSYSKEGFIHLEKFSKLFLNLFFESVWLTKVLFSSV